MESLAGRTCRGNARKPRPTHYAFAIPPVQAISEPQFSQLYNGAIVVWESPETTKQGLRWVTICYSLISLAFLVVLKIKPKAFLGSTAKLHLKLFFWDKVSLSCQGCPRTFHVAQASLELLFFMPQASEQLGLQVCSTMPGHRFLHCDSSTGAGRTRLKTSEPPWQWSGNIFLNVKKRLGAGLSGTCL